MQLYRLVYCVDCAVPVYWVGLGERQRVERIRLNKSNRKEIVPIKKKSGNSKNNFEEYLVFRCDVCEDKLVESRQ